MSEFTLSDSFDKGISAKSYWLLFRIFAIKHDAILKLDEGTLREIIHDADVGEEQLALIRNLIHELVEGAHTLGDVAAPFDSDVGQKVEPCTH